MNDIGMATVADVGRRMSELGIAALSMSSDLRDALGEAGSLAALLQIRPVEVLGEITKAALDDYDAYNFRVLTNACLLSDGRSQPVLLDSISDQLTGGGQTPSDMQKIGSLERLQRLGLCIRHVEKVELTRLGEDFVRLGLLQALHGFDVTHAAE